MSTTAIPKNCRCETVFPGCIDAYVDMERCPLHGDGAACIICKAPLDMSQDEIGYDDEEEPLGLPCEDCGRRLDDDAREAEHEADMAEAAERYYA